MKQASSYGSVVAMKAAAAISEAEERLKQATETTTTTNTIATTPSISEELNIVRLILIVISIKLAKRFWITITHLMILTAQAKR